MRHPLSRIAGRIAVSTLCALTLITASSCSSSAPATPAPASPAATMPGTPGHYDNGEFSFDYPADWPIVDVGPPRPYADTTKLIYGVLGTGTWDSGCTGGEGMPSLGPGEYAASPVVGWMSCTGEKFDVAPGGILVEIYRWYGGPVVFCNGDQQANATFGELAVRETDNGSVVSWEIRDPGNEFGKPNNIFIQVHTSDPGHLAQAKAMIGSFRWPTGTASQLSCAPTESPGSSGS